MKMNVKIIMTLLLCLITICMYSAEETYDIAVKNSDGVTIYYNYTNNGEELSVTCFYYNFYNPSSSYKGTIRIPETVTFMNRTRKVTKIGDLAFYNCKIDSVSLPKTIKSIERRAFMKCKIESIRLPEGLEEIDYEAFLDCQMKSINIPSTLKNIYAEAFNGCSYLNKVIVSDIATWFNISFIYFWPYETTSYAYTTYPIAYGKLYSDENTQIKDLVIPEGVTTIPKYMFKGHKRLHSIKFPSSLKYINESAFENSEIIFYLNDGLVTIGDRAFYKCSGLPSSLKLPASMKSIGKNAFVGCSFDSVYIPKNITSIGSKAFGDCDIPEVVSLIENPFEITTDVFSTNTYYNATLYVPVGTKNKYKATKGWKQFYFIVEGTPSDIKNVTLDKETNIPIYDLTGRRLKKPNKGVNIISGKKIVIK